MRIFISYSSKDGTIYAKKLFEVLSRRGHDPYLADHGCVSEIIWDEIAEEIKKREQIIFVVTESSQESKGQKQEYRLVVAKYKERRMAFESEKALEMKILDNVFPFLVPYRGLVFNDSNLEEKCERISTHLVKLQDMHARAPRKIDRKEKLFPKLTLEGLDKSEIAKCIENLFESYQMETVIPEAFSTHEADKLEGLMNIGFNYRLPRQWFLSYDETHTIYSNELLFRQFGRKIALGEIKYLNDQVMNNKKVFYVEGKDFSAKYLLETINDAVSVIRANGFEPKIIFPTIDHWMKMHALSRAGGKAHLKYSNITPRPRLNSSLIINGTETKLIAPLGEIPKNTIVFGDRAVRWHVKRQPKHGSLYIDVGNDRLYHKKYVQVVAMTTARCEIDPKGIVVIKIKNDDADKTN